jgi:hypothetical protein
MTVHGFGNPQIAVQRLGIRLIHQPATDVVQELSHLGFTDIQHAGLQGPPVIERRTNHLRSGRLLVPTGLQFDASGLDTSAMQQVFDIDRKNRRHERMLKYLSNKTCQQVRRLPHA